jgi:hypothetical protein
VRALRARADAATPPLHRLTDKDEHAAHGAAKALTLQAFGEHVALLEGLADDASRRLHLTTASTSNRALRVHSAGRIVKSPGFINWADQVTPLRCTCSLAAEISGLMALEWPRRVFVAGV